MTGTILAHSFDIETAGPRVNQHSLLSIAACCLEIPRRGQPVILRRFFVTIAWPDGPVFHEDTRAFWGKHPEMLRVNTTGGVSLRKAAEQLRDHVCEVQTMAEKRRAEYVLVTDNPYFDVAWIDALLTKYTENGQPLRYNYVTGWMSDAQMINVTERILALKEVGLSLNMQAFRPSVPHDHHPLHDAIRLAELYAHYRRGTAIMRRDSEETHRRGRGGRRRGGRATCG